jgi:hypothetical protein
MRRAGTHFRTHQGLRVGLTFTIALGLATLPAGCGDDSAGTNDSDASVQGDVATGGDGGGGGDAEVEADADLGPAQCDDGIDNDGDGLVDWQLDLGCTGPGDRTEGGLNNELEDGWTVFEAAADTSIYYVSSATGDDAYSGLSPEWDGTDGPKATAAAGIALLQDGQPDWLLFRRGDVWVDETLGNWSISGRSESEPVIIGSYGDSTERPRFEVSNTWLITHGGGGASEQRSHVRILGVHVFMYSKDPDDPRFTGFGGSCLQWLRDGGDVLMEDLKCEYAQLNLQSDPTLPLTVRRSVLTGNYALDSHAQSMFTSIAAPLLVEENIMNHGGWSDVFRLVLWEPETNHVVWAAISDGRFGLELDGSFYDVDGVDLGGSGSMADVATTLEAAINGVVGAGAVELRFTDGGVFQLRAPGFDSGPDYGVTAYAGSTAGTDLDPLFNPSAQGSPESTIFNRNMYLSHGFGNTTVRGNIDANGASGGLQQRMGGVCDGNLFLRNPIAITFGSSQNDGDQYVGGAITNNVILGARNIDTQVQGTGISVGSYTTTDGGGHALIRDLEISGNIAAHNVHGTGNIRVLLLQGDGAHENVSVHNNIVYDWAKPAWPDPMDQRAFGFQLNCAAGSTGVEIFDNILQQPGGGFLMSSNNDAAGVGLHDNVYFSSAPDPPDVWSRGWFNLSGSVSMTEWLAATGETAATAEQVVFVDPDRTLETYMESLGLEATYEAFMTEAVGQSKYNWRPEFTAAATNAYIRAGFQ